MLRQTKALVAQGNLLIREDTKTGLYVENLTEEPICSIKEVTRLLKKSVSMDNEFLCSNCKCKNIDEVKEINDGSDLQLVPVNESPSVDNNSKQSKVEKVLAGAIRREMALEEFCTKKHTEIMQLNRLYQHERECNSIIGQLQEDKIARLESLMEGVLSAEDFVNEELISLADNNKFRIYEKVNDRWEVCVSMADGHHFEQEYNFVSKVIEMSDDSYFEAVVAPPEEKKKGAVGQKLITEVLKPLNKKSGSVQGRMNNKDDAIGEDEAMGVGESSGEGEQEEDDLCVVSYPDEEEP
ncbi:hypothetical protein CTI12_AA094950 [Artemisia annua]|uniref:Uncharacterized protein n=1 Tax=Artemisia annua TaxID=35608 RepID=A0A2U1PZ03_ARTAN|nr:hypothetical protein CTI12_AA094950 [Artemisia annua]